MNVPVELLAVLLAAGIGPHAAHLACRETHADWQPSAIESASVVALAGLLTTWAIRSPVPALLLPLAVLGAVAANVDAFEARLPDALTATMLALTAVVSLLTAGPGPLAAAALGTGIAVALKAVARDAVGWGDVKLAPTPLIVLAQHGALTVGVLIMGTLVAATVLMVAACERTGIVPFGPAVVIGALTAAG